MEDLQLVVSVLKTSCPVSRKAFEVKSGLKSVGMVYLIPSFDESYGHHFNDIGMEHRDGTRWMYEADFDHGTSMDKGNSYGSRLEAVFALLSASEAA